MERFGDHRPNLLRVLTYHRVDEPENRPFLFPGLISATPAEFDCNVKTPVDAWTEDRWVTGVSLWDVVASLGHDQLDVRYSLSFLYGENGEGGDRLLRDVDPEAYDINLALSVGYFFTQCELPVPPSSPHIRDHQRWQGEVCWDWLAERRGWS